MQIVVYAGMKSTKQGKNSKNNPVVVESVLNSKCKSFRDTAIRQNFKLKPETQTRKTHSNN